MTTSSLSQAIDITDATAQHPGFKTWLCRICGLVYDEEAGWPGDGLEPGTRWADVPESWCCPECGVRKADFEMVPV